MRVTSSVLIMALSLMAGNALAIPMPDEVTQDGTALPQVIERAQHANEKRTEKGVDLTSLREYTDYLVKRADKGVDLTSLREYTDYLVKRADKGVDLTSLREYTDYLVKRADKGVDLTSLREYTDYLV